MAVMQNLETPWNDDQLAEDVAIISYEKALRAHARVHPASSELQSDRKTVGKNLNRPKCESDQATAPKPLKNASITIRLSESECEQLRHRAAEAGMSVSAYLRSCTLEVESLRAQVKETLAELRCSAARPEPPQKKADQAGWLATVIDGVRALFRRCGGRPRPALRLNSANPFAPWQS